MLSLLVIKNECKKHPLCEHILNSSLTKHLMGSDGKPHLTRTLCNAGAL